MFALPNIAITCGTRRFVTISIADWPTRTRIGTHYVGLNIQEEGPEPFKAVSTI